MKKSILLGIISCLLICNSYSQKELRIMESLNMPSRILNQDVHFSVCLPKNYYAENQTYPVVYLLHGLGDDETSWLEYGRISQYYDQLIDEKEVVPMIFVMPDGYRTYYVNDYKGSFLYQDMFVNELVPYIDSVFRTIRDRQHRALMGYSMGGFGALNLHLKYPKIFGATVPLSISVRTDEQYKLEDASEWNDQWGRLFGEPGFLGSNRITPYYQQNSPFHILPHLSANVSSMLNIYIDNGDKEQTLCRSNEELHILMQNLKIPHQFRVRDGDHSFRYWCSALPNALRFISDAFEGKPYRGDISLKKIVNLSAKNPSNSFSINKQEYIAYVPEEYSFTNRLYPVIYFAGNFNSSERKSIASFINQEINTNAAAPVILVFLPRNSISGLAAVLPEIETNLRIRKGYRFRALAGYQDDAIESCRLFVDAPLFRTCCISDGYLQKDRIANVLSKTTADQFNRMMFYIDAPDKGNYYEGNGNAHIILRTKEIPHEYRVREGDGGFEWYLAGLSDIINYTTNRFHK